MCRRTQRLMHASHIGTHSPSQASNHQTDCSCSSSFPILGSYCRCTAEIEEENHLESHQHVMNCRCGGEVKRQDLVNHGWQGRERIHAVLSSATRNLAKRLSALAFGLKSDEIGQQPRIRLDEVSQTRSLPGRRPRHGSWPPSRLQFSRSRQKPDIQKPRSHPNG